jgi:hypothetical protein
MKTKMAVGLPEAIRVMLQSKDIEYAEPNYIYTLDTMSSDPYATADKL